MAQFEPGPLTGLAGLATPLYVGLTVLVAIHLTRAGVPYNRLGFGLPFRPLLHLGLAAGAVLVIRVLGMFIDPFWDELFGGGRDLQRFASVAGSPVALFKLLFLNWTLAALGEELAFRIVLMRGLAYALGDSRWGLGLALIVQAVVFGFVHLYQGPAGVIGSALNGLVFGSVVLLARGSIWPAAIAHGASNTIGIVALYLGH